jgi:hypothetical protein
MDREVRRLKLSPRQSACDSTLMDAAASRFRLLRTPHHQQCYFCRLR